MKLTKSELRKLIKEEILALKEANIPAVVVDRDPDKTERNFNNLFKYLAKGHPTIDYGPRESDIYDWNSRRNYDDAIKEYNKYMRGLADQLNKATRNMDSIWKVWNVIRDKYRKKDDSE